MEAPPPLTWQGALLRALLRGALVAATLAAAGALVYGLALGSRLTASILISELAFDACLGLFVATPAAFAELRWGPHLKRPHIPALGVAIGVVAFLGATLAFLQSHYTAATLRTGSLEEGLAAVTTASTWLARYGDLVPLFAFIAVVFATVSCARLLGLHPGLQALLTLSGVMPLALVVFLAAQLTGLPLVISLTMLAVASGLLPFLCNLSDVLARRLLGDAQEASQGA